MGIYLADRLHFVYKSILSQIFIWGYISFQAFVTLGVVMGAFLLCWLPFFSWYLTVTICGDNCPCPDIAVAILFWIGYFNSTLNPIIYVMTNQEFKVAFTSIVARVFCCKKLSSVSRARDQEIEYYRSVGSHYTCILCTVSLNHIHYP